MHSTARELWCLDAAELEGVTPAAARDLMVDCFWTAQTETMRRTSQAMRVEIDDNEIRKQIAGIVRMAFGDLGYDYSQPTPESLEAVMEHLARESHSWGTPDDIVDHHLSEYRKVLRAIAN